VCTPYTDSPRVANLPELANLKTKLDLREKQLSELICAAFEDAKVPQIS